MERQASFYDRPFSELISLAASKSPVPGGGSVSAMAAVLGASMAEMVANLTLGKEGYDERRGEVEDLLSRVRKGAEELKVLTQSDMDAFEGLLSAQRLAAGTEEEKSLRDGDIQMNTVSATIAPLEIASAANDLLSCSRRLAVIGNRAAVSDAAVAAVLLEAAARSAILSVDINFMNIRDKRLQDDILARRNKILEESRQSLEQTLSAAASRNADHGVSASKAR